MKIRSFLLAMMLCALCVTQASALEYDFDAPEDYLFGQPTSDDTIYEWENPNVDRSKNAALIAPGFGTPTSYLPGSGEYLTPNLVPGALSGGLVNQVGSAGANATGGVAGSSVIPGQYPSVSGNVTMAQIPSSSPIPGITHKMSVKLPPTQATPTASGISSSPTPAARSSSTRKERSCTPENTPSPRWSLLPASR